MAADFWCSDPAAAEEQCGPISKWDVSCVSNMEELFFVKYVYNCEQFILGCAFVSLRDLLRQPT